MHRKGCCFEKRRRGIFTTAVAFPLYTLTQKVSIFSLSRRGRDTKMRSGEFYVSPDPNNVSLVPRGILNKVRLLFFSTFTHKGTTLCILLSRLDGLLVQLMSSLYRKIADKLINL